MKKYILALDQGTTSSRAILFDRNGRIAGKSQREFTQIYPQPGWVEHDPLELLQSQLDAMVGAVKDAGANAGEIAAIGITNQRETTVVWDKETGRPIYNAIVWQCRRTASLCEQLKKDGLEPYIREKTGLLIDAYFSATKIRWILDHVPGAREMAISGRLLFGTVDTWLIWNITGGRSHVTDYSNASRTMLFDIGALRWDPPLCEKLGIPMTMLPQVKPSSCVFGEVAGGIDGVGELAGIPICGVAGDQPAALFGQGCFTPGQIKNTYGTGCFFLMFTGEKRIVSKNNLLTSVAWGLDGRVQYALECSVFSAGSVIKWLRDQLGIISTARECDTLAMSVPDTGGVYFVPAFTGLGAPYWDMYARGTMVGLTAGCGRAQIARAVLESIAFQVTDLLMAVREDSGIEPIELRVDGGASVSDIMMQFQSDMLNVPVNRPKTVETTALGAACLAGLAAGFWKDLGEVAGLREQDRIFTPQMDAGRRAALFAGWKRAVERSRGWAKPV
ncbi:MAG: glycerol kinase GlpK [Clostridia bacterium]|nr:glycerol kinase GlpK [Clostridia bacterium]